MVAVPDRAPAESSGPGEIAALVDGLGGCTDGELAERLLAGQGMRARLDAAVVAVTDVFDARLVWAGDGHRNGPGWVTARVGVSYGQAKTDLALARDLRAHPHITAAHQAGTLTRDQVRALLNACEPGLEEVFAVCETVLIDETASYTLAAGRRYLARWAQEVREALGLNEPDGPEPDGGIGGSRVSLSPVGDRWVGDLDLSAEDGEKVANAIDNQIDALWNDGVFTTGDGLDPAERRAIALVQVIERGTRGGDNDGTARPLILALTTLDTLTGDSTDHSDHTNTDTGTGDSTDDRDSGDPATDDRPAAGDPRSDHAPEPESHDPTPTAAPDTSAASSGPSAPPPRWDLPDDQTTPTTHHDDDPVPDLLAGLDPMTPFPAMLAELSRSGPVAPDIVRRLACEGTVIPVYVGPGAEQLNMGRKIRIANRAQRRALRVRDGGCQFPGCSVGPEWCIAHHLQWWEDGGRTDFINLILLCRHHHKAVHGGGFTMTRAPDGTITTTRTDDHPLTRALQPRPPLVRIRPPPDPPDPLTPDVDDHGSGPEDDGVADPDGEDWIDEVIADPVRCRFLVRCRLADDKRAADLRRHHQAQPTPTTPLRI